MKKKKAKKTNRSDHYDPKLKIDGSFEDVIGLSVNYTPKNKEKPAPKKQSKKAKK